MSRKRQTVYLTVSILLVLILLILSIIVPVEGDARSRRRSRSSSKKSSSSVKLLEQQKSRNAEQLRRIRRKLHEIRSQKNDMAKIVNQVDHELNMAVDKLNQIKRKEKIIKIQCERTAEELVVATDDFRKHRDRYRVRLVAMYKTGETSSLEILFKSDDLADFISRAHYLHVLANRDKTVLGELREKREIVQIKKDALERKKQEVAINREMQAQEKAQIEVISSEKHKQLTSLARSEEELARMERLLEVETSKIERQISQLIAQAQRYSSRPLAPTFHGALGNPICNGSWRVTSNWGPRRRPTRGASSFHKGIDLGISNGQSICAAADGTIIFAGSKRGYGVTVMVAHSQDLVTLHGHGKSIPSGIRPGAFVRRGQVIMYGDSSGVSTGHHLHFSVFRNGAAVNPMNYF